MFNYTCVKCNKEFTRQRELKTENVFCSIECRKIYNQRKAKIYNKLKNYKNPLMEENDPDSILLGLEKNNGFNVMDNGYIRVYKPDYKYCHSSGQALEHRIIAEQKLGRRLDPNEVVHHIDGDTENNDPDNLMVFASISEHTRYHANN